VNKDVVHNTGTTVMGMRGVKPRNTNHQEAFTSLFRKGISRMQIRIESFM
jgi:hypothetical protein